MPRRRKLRLKEFTNSLQVTRSEIVTTRSTLSRQTPKPAPSFQGGLDILVEAQEPGAGMVINAIILLHRSPLIRHLRAEPGYRPGKLPGP